MEMMGKKRQKNRALEQIEERKSKRWRFGVSGCSTSKNESQEFEFVRKMRKK
jgi:hypothetical protein